MALGLAYGANVSEGTLLELVRQAGVVVSSGRRAFAHEKEVRFIVTEFPDRYQRLVQRTDTPPTGLPIAANLQILISEVVLPPNSPTWFSQLVTSITRKYGSNAPVRASAMDVDPPYRRTPYPIE